MKTLIWTCLFLILSLQTQAVLLPGLAEPPVRKKHYVFLIHGISGSEKTFGALPEILTNHMQKIQPQLEIKVVPLKYETGDPRLTTYDFAHRIGDFILKETQDLGPEDRISLVAHSQGGLISWIWYILSTNKTSTFEKYEPIARQIDGFLTLGSPMWGSRIATFASQGEVVKSLIELGRNMGLNMGPKELEEMRYGSDSILRFRRRAIRLDQERYVLPIRTHAVAGVMPGSWEPTIKGLGLKNQILLNMAEAHLGFGGRLESDLMVDLSSARFDFIYMKPSASRLSKVSADQFQFFNEHSLGSLSIVKAPHMTLDKKRYFDMAEVPEECMDVRTPCTHPTYPIILSFLTNCSSLQTQCNQDAFQSILIPLVSSPQFAFRMSKDTGVNEMKNFQVDLNFQVPSYYKIPDAGTVWKSIEFGKNPEGRYGSPDSSLYSFVLSPATALAGVTVKQSDFRLKPPYSDLENHLRVSFHASLRLDPGTKPFGGAYRWPIRIRLPGLPERDVELLVKPTYSTFADIIY